MEEENKLKINWKKTLLTIAIILISVAAVIFVFYLMKDFSKIVSEDKIEQPINRELTIEERKKILRDRYVKRELTPAEKEKVDLLKSRYEEMKKEEKKTVKEKTEEQKQLEERIRILQERQNN